MRHIIDEQSDETVQRVLYMEEEESQMNHFLAAVAMVDSRLLQFYWAHQEGNLPEFIEPGHLSEYTPEHLPYWSMQTANWSCSIPEFSLAQHSRLTRLAEDYQLTNFELTAVIVGCLNAFEPRYQQLFSGMPFQRNGQPSLELILAVFCTGTYARQAYEQSFSTSAPLLHYSLIELLPEKTSGYRIFQTPEWVRQWLLGEYRLPGDLERFTRWLEPQPDGASSDLETLPVLELLPPLLEIRCAPGADSEASMGTLAQRMGTRALLVSWSYLLADARGAVRMLIQLLSITRLWGILLVLNLEGSCEIKSEDDIHQVNIRETLIQLVTQFGQEGMPRPICCLLSSDDARFPFPDLSRLMVNLRAPDAATRYEQFITLLKEEPDWDARQLIQQVALSWHDMRNAIDETRALSCRNAVPQESDFRQTFLRRARQNFGRLAQRISPQRRWQDIVIDVELKEELCDLLMAVRCREAVLARGFSHKLGLATGISSLFYGNPGTGKTLVAEILAAELGVDLIKVDLSTVVNKYIGETEKNLGRIFDLAAQDAGVLFFDEADALFGKRSESKDAKDRHANIEVAYLLQRLEQHPGLVILATNNRSHLDDAFTRRFTFITRFHWPDTVLREKMWRQAWPTEFSLAPDVNFSRLAQVQLTGANIRNIALQASWLAAEETCISSAHIDKAMKREMAKMGRNL